MRRLPHQPGARGGRRADHHGRWHDLRDRAGLHLLRRAGYDQAFLADITRVMEYTRAYEMYRDNVEGWPPDDGDAAAARAAGATQAMQPGY